MNIQASPLLHPRPVRFSSTEETGPVPIETFLESWKTATISDPGDMAQRIVAQSDMALRIIAQISRVPEDDRNKAFLAVADSMFDKPRCSFKASHKTALLEEFDSLSAKQQGPVYVYCEVKQNMMEKPSHFDSGITFNNLARMFDMMPSSTRTLTTDLFQEPKV